MGRLASHREPQLDAEDTPDNQADEKVAAQGEEQRPASGPAELIEAGHEEAVGDENAGGSHRDQAEQRPPADDGSKDPRESAQGPADVGEL